MATKAPMVRGVPRISTIGIKVQNNHTAELLTDVTAQESTGMLEYEGGGPAIQIRMSCSTQTAREP